MVISVSDLHFSYGKRSILENLNFEIAENEVVALLGPNGVGKTTLLDIILGQLNPQNGSVSVLGKTPRYQDAKFWMEIGIVQQHWRDHPKWPVKDHLEWARSLYQAAGKKPKTVAEALAEVDASEHINQPLAKLSGGLRRRIDFATATLGNPKLLILDEPSTGLDVEARHNIHQLIDQATLNGATVLFTTHDLDEAEKVASRIMILNSKQILADDTPSHLRTKHTPLAQISWKDSAGNTQVHATNEVEKFVAQLPLTQISELTITRPTLETAYLDLMSKGEKDD
ncbi:ABC transporter ATP-binding protein [Gleimia sp. 6138-11-ORH1]|uniref:ABC transporter ATP-binding protein n=1 Tax=Gleimia sp. 6138-11-ORH1 TaxID=2973937 RepID=UPI002166CADB|nr:ABC transporter ATP-binding protein [Gleimia sp. 6138-11-ORH1]MCS4484159.1 ABC transporter ATP-binding protein [Gleimia sp. 6138-11-ORH1]